MKKIEIYSTPTCTYCRAVKEYLATKGAEYIEHDVAADETMRNQMVEKSGQMGVPVIDIEGTIIVGFDEEAIDAALSESDEAPLKMAA